MIQTRKFTMFTNNKLWLTKELKVCLSKGKIAFLKGNTVIFHGKKTEIRSKINRAKIDFKIRLKISSLQGTLIRHGRVLTG